MSEEERVMTDYTPTPEVVEAFKRAWHEADAEGDTGNRTLRGLTAAGPIIAAEALREAAIAVGTYDEGDVHLWARDADTWLLDRADRIEKEADDDR